MLPLLLLVVAVLVLVWAGQRRLMYFPLGGVPDLATASLPAAEAVTFTTEDGVELGGWFVPAAGQPTGDTVIVFNGNAGHRGYRAPLARALAARGIATLLFDYRGYGGNPGSPSEEGLAADGRAVRAYVTQRPGVDAERIVLFGESLGTAVAVRLAAEHRPAALILRSPFTSMSDIGGHHYPFLPVRWILRDRYPSIDRIARVGCPVLVVAGERDEVIPFSHSERLYHAAREPKRLLQIKGARHNDLSLLAGAELVDAVVEFLSQKRKP
jgi:hypothetical protein